MDALADCIRAGDIALAILAVPADAAQKVAGQLCEASIAGILNFTPIRLHVPKGIYVADVNITMALEKVAYFTHKTAECQKEEELA